MQSLAWQDLFEQLLRHRNQTMDVACLGPWLEQQVHHPRYKTPSLPFAAGGYTRTCVGREDGPHCFEALLLRWDRQVKTTIHGHPAFSFYAVIDGLFEMEFFSSCDRTPTGLYPRGSQLFQPGDVAWNLGQPGRYDNFIHRVTCLKPGCTFHVYSDDAQKGVCYQPTKVTIFSNRSREVPHLQ